MTTPTNPNNPPAGGGGHATLRWTEDGVAREARWHSESGRPPPTRVMVADDTTTADRAYRLACEGVALLWRGDFQNARQLLQAIARRAERPAQKAKAAPTEMRAIFHEQRRLQVQRVRVLGMLLIPLADDYAIPLRRAPDVREACVETWGPCDGPAVVSLRELLGIVGAHEWRKTGVEVAALDARIHPYYGVFAPIRGEYVDLVARAPLPARTLAFDVGTGTGVLAAVLARRGVERVVATDSDARALACAKENVERLGLEDRIDVIEADLFPAGRAPLVVCNPPWVPASAGSAMERAIYDPDSRMLKGFLAGLAAHLTPEGEGWLLLSDFAEHLGLRTRDELLGWIAAGGLRVVDRIGARPTHPRVADREDPLHAARAAEVTSLWRLGSGS